MAREHLLRGSPQLRGASASPTWKHAAIHRLITMEEPSGGWVKEGTAQTAISFLLLFYFFFFSFLMHRLSHLRSCTLHRLQQQTLPRAGNKNKTEISGQKGMNRGLETAAQLVSG